VNLPPIAIAAAAGSWNAAIASSVEVLEIEWFDLKKGPTSCERN